MSCKLNDICVVGPAQWEIGTHVLSCSVASAPPTVRPAPALPLVQGEGQLQPDPWPCHGLLEPTSAAEMAVEFATGTQD